MLNKLKNISYPHIRILLILSYFTKNVPTHFSLCKSVILCRCSNVTPLTEVGHAGSNLQLNICEKSSFTTLQKGHSRFDGYSPIKLIFFSNIFNLASKIIWAYSGSNSVRYMGCSNLVYLIYDAFFTWEHSLQNVWKTNLLTWLFTVVFHQGFDRFSMLRSFRGRSYFPRKPRTLFGQLGSNSYFSISMYASHTGSDQTLLNT